MEFIEKPTHHYIKPFERALQTEDLIPPVKPPEDNKKEWIETCSGARYVQKRTEVLKDFLDKYKNRKFFAFAYYDILTHDNQNGMSLMKKYVSDILDYLKTNDLLRNTLTVFFSDHGTRISSYVYTDLGFYEARLPFIYVMVPPWFQSKHKRLYLNLKNHSRTLTSNFDIYKTLLRVLHNKFQEEEFGRKFQKPGHSLFNIMSSKRTCQDAGIPEQWCACVKLVPLPNNYAAVKMAATLLTDSINRELSVKAPGKCKTYQLYRILSAQTPGIQGVAKLNGVKTIYPGNSILVSIEVLPNFAKFRGLVPLDTTKKKNTIVEVERLDRYGSQSHCLEHHPHFSNLRHKCFCI